MAAFVYKHLDTTLFPTVCVVDLGFKHDHSAISVIQNDGTNFGQVYAEEFAAKQGEPLKPSEVCRSFATIAKMYGLKALYGDIHYFETLREICLDLGIVVWPIEQQHKTEAWKAAQNLAEEGRLKVFPVTAEQMPKAIWVYRSGGTITPVVPRNKTGHGDLLTTAVWGTYYCKKLGAPRTVKPVRSKEEQAEIDEIERAEEFGPWS